MPKKNGLNVRSGMSSALLSSLPILVLSLTLGASSFVVVRERQASQKAIRTQFDFALRETVSRIERGTYDYELILRGIQSHLASSPIRNLETMKNYVENLKLDANFAGIKSIGLVDWIPSKRTAAIAAVTGGSSLGESIAETAGRNIWLDAVQRRALEKSRDSGLPSITGKMDFIVDAETGVTPGFIMFLPIYLQGGESLVGWIYAVFYLHDFMSSLYGSLPPGLSLALYDGTQVLESALLFRSDDSSPAIDAFRPSVAKANEYMVVSSHNWLLSMHTLQEFEARYGSGTETAIAGSGIVLSILLALLTWLIIYGQKRNLLLEENRKKNDSLNIVLKEVHHRIKNNMNTMTSLLSLQALNMKDQAAVSALQDAGERIRSMGLLYDKLYQTSDFSELSLKSYLPALIDEIVANYCGIVSVSVAKNIQDIVLGAKIIQPLGMIINELLTNSMKYAFTGKSDGTITVSAVRAAATVMVSVEDNGKGMPQSISFENSTGFGMFLVQALTKQLNGKIRIERAAGTKIILEFEP